MIETDNNTRNIKYNKFEANISIHISYPQFYQDKKAANYIIIEQHQKFVTIILC